MTGRESSDEEVECTDVDPQQLERQLGEYYRFIAELFNNPEDLDRTRLMAQADETLESMARTLGPETVESMRVFTKEVWGVGNDYYVDNLELDPTIPLYLGSYAFPEPKTCSDLGRSERNQYMIELVDLYRLSDLETDGTELPDYLPLMVEFLWLSLDGGHHGTRHQVLSDYLLPVLPQLIARLEEEESPYLALVTTLNRVAEVDLACVDAGEAPPDGPGDMRTRTMETGNIGSGGVGI